MPEKNQNLDKLNKIFGALNDISGSNRPDDLSRRIELCQEALEIIPKEKYLDLWAKLKFDLATSLLQIPAGERGDNLEQAIGHYQQALEVRTRATHPEHWAMIHFNLAGAYYKRICEQRAKNLEQAFWHCEQALQVFTREEFPHEWAQTSNTLGELYRFRILGTRKENLEEAISHFEQALEVQKRETFTEDWAMLQNNLAAAYTDRILGNRAENIEKAITHARQALEVRTRESDEERWAMTMHILGRAYRHRIHSDQTEKFERAIHCFEQALEVRTRKRFPKDWAETQNSLGDAYLGRLERKPDTDIGKAIDHFQQALEVYTYEIFPEYWAQVQINLGNAYLAIPGNREKNTEKAIQHYEQALRVRTEAIFPEDWAQAHNNLGGAYIGWIEGDRADNIEKAIQHLQQTLHVYTQESFPQDWAGVQRNLAIAYNHRTRDTRTKNIEQAIQYCQQALKVYTHLAFPNDCLDTARALGNLAFEEKRWELTTNAYSTAFDAQDVLMQASFSRTGKQTELSAVQDLPARAAYAHVQAGDPERAVQVLERGRAQLLRESLERQRQDLKRLPELGFRSLYENYTRAVGKYDELQNTKTPENARREDWVAEMEQTLENIQAATVAIREQAGAKHSQYRYFLQAMPFDEIQKQAHERALVYLSAASVGGLALLVTPKGVRSIPLPKLTQDALDTVKEEYFSMYELWSAASPSREINDAWQKTLDQTTQWLWDAAMRELIPTLKEERIESITLIPIGYLALLPLHAAWTDDPTTPTRRWYAMDELNITYAPSVHALWQAGLAAGRPTESLLVVDNPDGSLHAAKDEARTALDLFASVVHLSGEKATVKVVKEKMPEANVLHFATHGNAGWQEENEARLKLADDYLPLSDIFALHLRQARLAVLSACETGVPGLKLINEMIGLPTGMMQAGVPGVVGSLWSVNDRSTAMLMTRFYIFWKEDGKDPREALRQAQIWLRDSTVDQKKEFFKSLITKKHSEMSTAMALSFYKKLSAAEPGEIDFSSPYYWAAFTYTGV